MVRQHETRFMKLWNNKQLKKPRFILRQDREIPPINCGRQETSPKNNTVELILKFVMCNNEKIMQPNNTRMG